MVDKTSTRKVRKHIYILIFIDVKDFDQACRIQPEEVKY